MLTLKGFAYDMLETIWCVTKCVLFAALVGLVLAVAARADALDYYCQNGNVTACIAIEQRQIADQQNFQAGINNMTNYLTAQQMLANQPQFVYHPITCVQQGVFVVCQ